MKQYILPTHTCFDDALDTLSEMVKASPGRTDDLFLVHGLCRAPDGNLYAHAWVEWTAGETVRCLFSGIRDGKRDYFSAERTEYHTEGCVEETTRYSVKQAWAMNELYGTYGPWVPRYLEHCTAVLPLRMIERKLPHAQ